jgi:hypothetical protein
LVQQPRSNESQQLDIRVWSYQADNSFATRYLDKLQAPLVPPPVTAADPLEQLCKQCALLNFWTPGFHIVDKLSELKIRAPACHFCKMRWDASKALEHQTSQVRFERTGSVIKMDDSDPPVFTLCRDRGK